MFSEVYDWGRQQWQCCESNEGLRDAQDVRALAKRGAQVSYIQQRRDGTGQDRNTTVTRVEIYTT